MLMLRSFSKQAFSVVNNVAKQQFTITQPGGEAFLQYERSGNTLTFTRTEVPQALQGKGLAKVLVEHALRYSQDNNIEVISDCQFVSEYYEKNRDKFPSLKITIKQ